MVDAAKMPPGGTTEGLMPGDVQSWFRGPAPARNPRHGRRTWATAVAAWGVWFVRPSGEGNQGTDKITNWGAKPKEAIPSLSRKQRVLYYVIKHEVLPVTEVEEGSTTGYRPRHAQCRAAPATPCTTAVPHTSACRQPHDAWPCRPHLAPVAPARDTSRTAHTTNLAAWPRRPHTHDQASTSHAQQLMPRIAAARRWSSRARARHTQHGRRKHRLATPCHSAAVRTVAASHDAPAMPCTAAARTLHSREKRKGKGKRKERREKKGKKAKVPTRAHMVAVDTAIGVDTTAYPSTCTTPLDILAATAGATNEEAITPEQIFAELGYLHVFQLTPILIYEANIGGADL
uniref:Uncharacterized protein n=1 Tax=Oryza punctata TaxID=4537 RepID=A0A0E0LSZ9_ORYPU